MPNSQAGKATPPTEMDDGPPEEGGPIVPGPVESEIGESDKRAKKELDALERGEPLVGAKNYADRRKIFRRDQLQDALHWTVRFFIRFAIFPVIAFVSVWAWHKLGPPGHRWLDPDEINNLQAILFSGAISALVAVIGQNVLKD